MFQRPNRYTDYSEQSSNQQDNGLIERESDVLAFVLEFKLHRLRLETIDGRTLLTNLRVYI